MCDCASCEATHRIKAWPKPTGDVQQFKVNALDRLPPADYPAKKLVILDRAYRAHVAHSYYGARKRLDFGPAGAGFYGTPKGMTKAQVEAILTKHYAPPRVYSPLSQLATKYRPTKETTA